MDNVQLIHYSMGKSKDEAANSGGSLNASLLTNPVPSSHCVPDANFEVSDANFVGKQQPMRINAIRD
jgi:hypothetical protein